MLDFAKAHNTLGDYECAETAVGGGGGRHRGYRRYSSYRNYRDYSIYSGYALREESTGAKKA